MGEHREGGIMSGKHLTHKEITDRIEDALWAHDKRFGYAGAREVQCKCGVWCAGIEELVRHRAARIANAIKGGVE